MGPLFSTGRGGIAQHPTRCVSCGRADGQHSLHQEKGLCSGQPACRSRRHLQVDGLDGWPRRRATRGLTLLTSSPLERVAVASCLVVWLFGCSMFLFFCFSRPSAALSSSLLPLSFGPHRHLAFLFYPFDSPPRLSCVFLYLAQCETTPQLAFYLRFLLALAV